MTQPRGALEGLAASFLLALACNGGSEGNADGEDDVAPPRTPAETPSRDAPVGTDDDTSSASPSDDDEKDEPAAPVGEAPEPPASEAGALPQCDAVLSFDDLYATIDDDLREEGDDGVFLRYVSLSNRLNQGFCPEDLDGDRKALIKAINSLSTEVSVAIPEAIDPDGIVYRVDLRDLGWDQPTTVDGVAFDDKWEAILAASPYAIEFEGDEADDAKVSANTAVPVLFGDALIDAATVGNLYYALIDVGESEDELLAQLGIDEEEQEENGTVIKVGTSRSRLSRQDTVAERLEVEDFRGYYWSRYDLDEATGGESIFANPLEFQEDSIAAVFSLPNGFNGYALFDAAGLRVTDTGVIVDQAQLDGRVRNSVSCSQCHAAGINPMTDEVRAYVEANSRDFDADTFEEALDAFRVQSEIDEVIEQDAALYASSLAAAGIDTVGVDPVNAAYVRFDGEVSLGVAAGELGVSPDVLREELSFVSNQVDGTLASLSDQSLRREQFEAVYLATLCALQITSGNRPAAAACATVGQ
jgi:hypothetical protein